MTLFTEYAKIRELHPDAIPLLRVGDFYETYGEGADTLARVLGLALTTRAGCRMAGFPCFYLEQYLARLVAAGLRVAVAAPAPGDDYNVTTRG